MEENKKPLAEGEEKEESVSKNFIEREIDKDLADEFWKQHESKCCLPRTVIKSLIKKRL